MQHSIDLAEADVKFHQARIAVMKADQAYREILDKEGLPYKDVEDRLRMVIAANRALNMLPEPAPCRGCGMVD